MAHWAHLKANVFPDLLPRINKHELNKNVFHSQKNEMVMSHTKTIQHNKPEVIYTERKPKHWSISSQSSDDHVDTSVFMSEGPQKLRSVFC